MKNYQMIRSAGFRVNLPLAILMTLLQRTPVVRVAVTAGELLVSSPCSAVLKAAFAVVGSLGAVHSLAGATTLSATTVSPASATVGTAKTIAFSVLGTQSPASSWTVSGSVPPGMSFNGGATIGIINITSGFLTISGSPTLAGSYVLSLKAWENTGGKGNVSPTFSYTINVSGAAVIAPSIVTQPVSQTAIVGGGATFISVASGTPTPTYQWQKNGATIAGETGTFLVLSNVQTGAAGIYAVVATNTAGAATSNAATLIVSLASALPVIATQPSSHTIGAGQSAVFSVVATGNPTPAYQWQKNGVAISGATGATLSISAAQLADSGSYAVSATNSVGAATSVPVTLTVTGGAGPAPAITLQPPGSLNLISNQSLALNVAATGSNLSYQWRRVNGTGVISIPGATGPTLTIKPVGSLDAGTYYCNVSNGAGSADSAPVAVAVTTASANPGRLINLSVLTGIATTGDSFSLGYVVSGASTANAKPLVIRAAGPSLGALGVPGTLSDPKMELFAGSARTEENDNWGGLSTISNAMAAVGAFPYSNAATLDSAVASSVTSRDNSVKISAGAGAPDATGSVIAEVYDATPSSAFDPVRTPRLINLSVLKNVGTGLTMGFVIGGSTGKTMLVRAIGPTLGTAFGLVGVMYDPKIELLDSSGKSLAINDNWGGTPALASAFGDTGAFELPAGSGDAALLITLAPGNYTAQVTVATGTTGLALVEVYDVP